MVQSQNYNRPLPPAVISESMLHQVAAAMPDMLRHDVTWSAKIPTTTHEATTISEPDIDTFLEAIAHRSGFTQVALEAFSAEKDTSFYLYCEPGSSLEYDCPDALREELARFAHTIQSMFNDTRRWLYWLPLRAPKFAVGCQPPNFLQRFEWQDIWNKVAADLIVRGVTFTAGLALGLGIGKFGL